MFWKRKPQTSMPKLRMAIEESRVPAAFYWMVWYEGNKEILVMNELGQIQPGCGLTMKEAIKKVVGETGRLSRNEPL